MTASPPQLTVVIPAYNEALAIGDVLDDLSAHADLIREVIVVDDASTDDTGDIARSKGARVIVHPANRGYGGSLKTGIRAAETEYIAMMDSDGQHKAADLVRLWDAREAHDMIVGQRTRLLHSPLWRLPGKWLLAWLIRRLLGQRVPDFNSGLRVLRREVVTRYLHICPSGFSFSTTTTMAILSRGYSVGWVPIEVEKRKGTSRVNFRTGLATIILMLRIACLFNPLRLFLPASALLAVAGIAWGAPYVYFGRGLSVGSVAILNTAILVFLLGLVSDQISALRLERYE